MCDSVCRRSFGPLSCSVSQKDSPFAVLFFESVAYLHAYLPVSHMVDGLVRERMPRDRQRITSAQTTVVTETWKQAIVGP